MHFRESTQRTLSAVYGAGWIIDQTGVCADRDWRAYALVYVTAGSGTYSDANGCAAAIGPGDLMVLFPGLVHTYGPGKGTWNEVWIGFRGPVFAALESDGVLDRRQPVWHPGRDEALIARFDALTAAVDRAAGTSDAALVASVHALIADLATMHSAPSPDGLVARARAELESDLRRPLDLPQLARRLGVSYDTLRRAFQSELGTTPGRWRQLRRIERAKQLLAAGETLEATAAATGFCDRFFLARQFRDVVGLPPGRWRTELLGSAERVAGSPRRRSRP